MPGARVYPDGRPSPVPVDRLEAARDLLERGRVTRILASGAGAEPAAMRRWLLAHGVPGDAILLDPRGARTLTTMERAAGVYAVRDAIVCTQRFHLARAVFLARACGIDAVGLAADRRRYRRRRAGPTARRAVGCRMAGRRRRAGHVCRRKDAAREALARTRALYDVLCKSDQVPIAESVIRTWSE